MYISSILYTSDNFGDNFNRLVRNLNQGIFFYVPYNHLRIYSYLFVGDFTITVQTSHIVLIF